MTTTLSGNGPLKRWATTDLPVDHEYCPDIKGTIYIQPLAWEKIEALMLTINKEWLAYLLGKNINEDIIVSDLVVPLQKTGPAAVDSVDEQPPKGCIGVIHSHVAMTAFFSGVDDKYINGNHDISIVVSQKRNAQLEFKSQVRSRVSCGISMLMDLPVCEVPSNDGVFDWAEGVKHKVGDSKVFPQAPGLPNYSSYYDDEPFQGRSATSTVARTVSSDYQDYEVLVTALAKPELPGLSATEIIETLDLDLIYGARRWLIQSGQTNVHNELLKFINRFLYDKDDAIDDESF